MFAIKSNNQANPSASQRILLADLNQMDDDSFFTHLDLRLEQSKIKFFSKELEELSISFIQRARHNETKSIRKINHALHRLEKRCLQKHRLEKSNTEQTSNYIYILRFLLKNMLDAESQEEFLIYFKSFNDIADDFQQQQRVRFKHSFWKSLQEVMDIRFVFIEAENEHTQKTYKQMGKIVLDAIASIPIVHVLFSMGTWWRNGITTVNSFVKENPFAPPPISFKEKVTHFFARHTKKIIAASITLAILSAVMPFAFPFIAPLAVSIVAMASDLMAIGGLMSAGVSALIFLQAARERARRISERLDHAATEINNALGLKNISATAKSTLSYVIKQLYGADKPKRITQIDNTPPAANSLFPKLKLVESNQHVSPELVTHFDAPRRRF